MLQSRRVIGELFKGIQCSVHICIFCYSVCPLSMYVSIWAQSLAKQAPMGHRRKKDPNSGKQAPMGNRREKVPVPGIAKWAKFQRFAQILGSPFRDFRNIPEYLGMPKIPKFLESG